MDALINSKSQIPKKKYKSHKLHEPKQSQLKTLFPYAAQSDELIPDLDFF